MSQKIIKTSIGWCILYKEKGELVYPPPLDGDRVYRVKDKTLNRRSVLQNSSLA